MNPVCALVGTQSPCRDLDHIPEGSPELPVPARVTGHFPATLQQEPAYSQAARRGLGGCGIVMYRTEISLGLNKTA